MKFIDAYNRLQEIQQELQNKDLYDVDKVLLLENEAKELYSFCNTHLHNLQHNTPNTGEHNKNDNNKKDNTNIYGNDMQDHGISDSRQKSISDLQ